MLGGFLIWAAHFAVVYGFTALACARGFASAQVVGLNTVSLVIGATTLLAVLGLALSLRRTFQTPMPAGSDDASTTPPSFTRYTTVAIAALALVAILWQALPVLFLPACSSY